VPGFVPETVGYLHGQETLLFLAGRLPMKGSMALQRCPENFFSTKVYRCQFFSFYLSVSAIQHENRLLPAFAERSAFF
jgi:hypothetical protein